MHNVMWKKWSQLPQMPQMHEHPAYIDAIWSKTFKCGTAVHTTLHCEQNYMQICVQTLWCCVPPVLTLPFTAICPMHPLLARCLILQGALYMHACMCPVSMGPFLFFLQFLSWFHTNTHVCTHWVYTHIFDVRRMQIWTLFLWCCLHAVWTLPFIHTGSISFVSHCTCCVN